MKLKPPEVSFVAVHIVIKFLLEILVVDFVSILVILKWFYYILSSTKQVLSNNACFVTLFLHLIKIQAFTAELLEPNLSIKFVRTEYKVPLLYRSTSGSLGFGLHMVYVNLGCNNFKFNLKIQINGDKPRPIKY